MVGRDRVDAETEAKRPSFWRSPGFLILLLVAVVGIATYWAQNSLDQRAAQAIAIQARFEEHLAAEDFKAAVADLGEYVTKTDPWHAQATKRLETAEARSNVYLKAKAHLDAREWDEGIRTLKEISGHKDADNLLKLARFSAAQGEAAAKKWRETLFYLGELPADYPGAAELKKTAANTYAAQLYSEAMEAKGKQQYAVAVGLLQSAKDTGGKVPADLEAQLTLMRDLSAKADAAARLENIRQNMNHYTSGTVRIAVGNAEFRSAVGSHYATGNGTFVVVFASVRNDGSSSEHANPNNFKLSTPDGYTVPYDTETYGLNGYFDAVDLGKGQETAGWLVFYLPKAQTYKLQYEGFRGSASKEIAPE